MTFLEAESCFKKYILGRWPDWKPNEMEQTDWLLNLQSFTEDCITKATFQYCQENELYKKPKLPKMLKYLQLNSKGKRTIRHPPLLFWLVRKKDGAMKPIYGITGKTYSDEQVNKIAAAISKKYSPDYQGDNWNPLFSRDETENFKYPLGFYPVDGQPLQEVAVSTEKKTVAEMTQDLFRPDKQVKDETRPANEYRENPDYDENYIPPDDEVPF